MNSTDQYIQFNNYLIEKFLEIDEIREMCQVESNIKCINRQIHLVREIHTEHSKIFPKKIHTMKYDQCTYFIRHIATMDELQQLKHEVEEKIKMYI